MESREKMAMHRQSNVMLSRVAASLYWMSRYLERAENLARLLDVNLQLSVDFDRQDAESLQEHWLPVLRSTGSEEAFLKVYPAADSVTVPEYLTFTGGEGCSIRSCVAAARENARQVRDQISFDMWEVLNDMWLFLKDAPDESIRGANAPGFYERVKRFSHLFQGLTDSTFSRNEGYEFIEFGKYLERADKTSRLLDIKYHILLPTVNDVGGAVDTLQWQAVLRSASALESYRRFYVQEIVPWKVAEFLLMSDSFPRSVRYCVERCDYFMHRIADIPASDYRTAGERRFGRFVQNLKFASIDEVMGAGLHEHLAMVQGELEAVGAHIYDAFMYHPPVDMAAEIRLHQQEQQQQIRLHHQQHQPHQ
jgi:uncharacterized alpha-E superfamily protein